MAKQEPTNCFHTGRMSRFCQAYRPRCSNSFASYSAPFKSTHYRIARSVSVCRYRGRCLTPCGFNTWSPSEIDAWRPREVRGDPSLRLDPRRGYPEGKLAPQEEWDVASEGRWFFALTSRRVCGLRTRHPMGDWSPAFAGVTRGA